MIEVTLEKLDKYYQLTEQARKKATPIAKNKEDKNRLEIMLKMCDNYIFDSKYFRDSGDLVSAFGAINYAHAWLDAAVRIRLLDGHGDDYLFTIPE